MSYDHAPAAGGQYRGYLIYYDPTPLPTRDYDWHFVHRDYDGAPDAFDRRVGAGVSAADCAQQIDEYYEGLEDDENSQLQFETEMGANDSFDDSQALASAGMIEEA